jgi:hypothetical protein
VNCRSGIDSTWISCDDSLDIGWGKLECYDWACISQITINDITKLTLKWTIPEPKLSSFNNSVAVEVN